jgi:hypothetical protein
VTDLGTLASAATRELLERTVPDVVHRYAELKGIRTRRTTAKLVAVAAAVVLGVGGWQLAGGSEHPNDVRPIAPVHLHLDDAVPAKPQVLATTRTTQRGDQIDFDRFDGVTDDGLVVRQRYTYHGDVTQLGLLDPTTGTTDWLPRPTWDLGEPQPLDLSADRLVYLVNQNGPSKLSLLTFDRGSGEWERQVFSSPQGVDRFFGFTGLLGDDDRLYLLDPVVGSVRWFSIGAGETEMRAEPELDGQQLAFSATARITADDSGRVVVTSLGGSPEIIEDRLPDGCQLQNGSPSVALAGGHPVLELPCHGHPALTVFDPGGRPYLTIDANLDVAAAGPSHLLLTDDVDAYDVDLDRRQLYDLDEHFHDELPVGGQVVGDLAVWNVVGPADDRSVYDVIWKAGRLP